MYTNTCRVTMVHFEVLRLCNTYSTRILDEAGTWECDKMKRPRDWLLCCCMYNPTGPATIGLGDRRNPDNDQAEPGICYWPVLSSAGRECLLLMVSLNTRTTQTPASVRDELQGEDCFDLLSEVWWLQRVK